LPNYAPHRTPEALRRQPSLVGPAPVSFVVSRHWQLGPLKWAAVQTLRHFQAPRFVCSPAWGGGFNPGIPSADSRWRACVWSLTGLLDFVRFASESLHPIPGFQPSRNCLCALGLIACRTVRARVASWGFPACALAALRVVSFGQCAQARGRAPDFVTSKLRRSPIFTASVLKGVPGFMGGGLTGRPTGRRGGTAASTKPCRPGAG
jgi:hypothetical protein